MSDIHRIASSTLARLTPDAARREVAWLTYKIEMDFLQDLLDRTEVYRQVVEAALPDLPPDHAAILELVWADIEDRIALEWEDDEPPDLERHNEIMRRIEIVRAEGDETIWYKALRVPRDEFDDPIWTHIHQILKSTCQPIEAAYNVFMDEIEEAYRTGRYDAYFEQRAAGRWPDIKRREPAVILGVERD